MCYVINHVTTSNGIGKWRKNGALVVTFSGLVIYFAIHSVSSSLSSPKELTPTGCIPASTLRFQPGGGGVLMASRRARPRPPPALRDRSGRAANPRLRRPSHRPLILYWLSFLLLLSVMIKSKFQFYTLYRIWRISVIWAPLVAEWRTTEEQQNKARLRILFCPHIRTHHHDIHGRPNRLWTQILAML